MTFDIIKILFGLLVAAELICKFTKCVTASDITYYICRPFGIPMKMIYGLLFRAILVACGSIALYSGIVSILNYLC